MTLAQCGAHYVSGNPLMHLNISLLLPTCTGTSENNLLFVNENARQLVKLKGYEQTGVHFHSLLAETDRGGQIQRFREFVVFDGKYTYPEYLLAYKRKSTPPGDMSPEPEPELAV